MLGWRCWLDVRPGWAVGCVGGDGEGRSAQDPGRVLRDLAGMLADGGDCVTDIDAYHGPGAVVRHARVGDHDASGDEVGRRAAARLAAGDAGRGSLARTGRGPRPESITLNIDATLVTAHSDKELAAGNYKHGYGFHPLGYWLDEASEALAAILRPGNAGPNIAFSHSTVLGLALAQPAEDLERDILVRANIGGATHAFTATARRQPHPLLGRLRAERQHPHGGARCPRSDVDTGDRRRRQATKGRLVSLN